MIIIGSTALKLAGISWREPKDIDYIATPEEVKWFEESYKDKIIHSNTSKWGKTYFVSGHDPIEIEIAYPGSNTEQLLKIIKDNNLYTINFDGVKWVSPYVVYMMKMSHRFLKNSKHFRKCMDDIIKLRKNIGYYIELYKDSKMMTEWFKRREKETYDYSHPKLNQVKDDFFANDGVPYEVEHDHIHEIIARLKLPAFNYIKLDTTNVLCSKDKFLKLSENIRLLCGLEETEVLAIERSQLPNKFSIDPKISFDKALEKVCTSITSGWFREFCWENYYKILELYDPEYVNKFRKVYDLGLVRPYRKE